ncbi:MAG: hypothetical protein J7M40_00605 [Planctomycetes bacterium]|nr:hypothetical protein [Planctomycetota bacterium]
MKYLFFAIGGFVLYNIFNVIKRTFQGTRYWTDCEFKYRALINKGYDKRDALLEISKERHPELSDEVHEGIVDKYPDLHRLVNFIYHALDFRPSTSFTYGGKLTDCRALALLEHTTVSNRNHVKTDYATVKKHNDIKSRRDLELVKNTKP